MPMNAREQQFVQEAADYLESPSLVIRLADLVGKPLDWLMSKLSVEQQERVAQVVRDALGVALAAATRSISAGGRRGFSSGVEASTGTWHTIGSALLGTLGGLGIAAMAVELPATTTLMLRGIASIADDFGHDIHDPAVRLECLSIFSYGSSRTQDDDAADSAYFGARVAMTQLVSEAAAWLAQATPEMLERAIAEGTAPALVRFMTNVAARFEISVSEKAMATAVPVIGAATGALINAAFSNHYQSVARYHFGLRALEQTHGPAAVEEAFRRALASQRAARRLAAEKVG